MSKKHPQLQLILPKKYDGIIEAVHYQPNGKVAWVRAYERRGPTWSDYVIIDRSALVERLLDGKRFFIGSRINFEASEFEVGAKLELRPASKKGLLVLADGDSPKTDTLPGVPVI